MSLVIRTAYAADAADLAAVAAATFPLACPPHTTEEAKADFIARNLSEASFRGYLDDAARDLFVAELDGRAVGYTMLIDGEPTDPDVAAAITTRPTIELSKVYVLADAHGSGVASALMAASLDAARERAPPRSGSASTRRTRARTASTRRAGSRSSEASGSWSATGTRTTSCGSWCSDPDARPVAAR
ncbi:hypothetical protein GCM10025881_12670 [Pseudolysinimonas kribbensis]|uniref:N-acetyltransferase domain-containing protein n=1 Tax=Pseudolysinimonas kribbensis TaxID=433641 RepID=A0ABQ6K4F9_9MICO|nr:hypothetical protein GCM10025881_12670 [Pseudolysinimonas kribbensis]